MQHIIYAMQFRGQATPVGTDGNVLKATTTAPSCVMTSTVGATGLRGELQPAAGGEATFESEVTFTSDNAFLESGVITFGDKRHRLRFSTVGSGHLGASPDSSIKHGTVMWRIDGGEGQFAGASGLVTSNFFVSEAGEVTDHHFGVIFVH